MITVMSALVAGLATVAAAVGLRALRLPRDARGPAALTLGLVAGWVVLAASGYALTLITIYLLFALGCGLVGAFGLLGRFSTLGFQLLGVLGLPGVIGGGVAPPVTTAYQGGGEQGC